jgi:hypothetical protein
VDGQTYPQAAAEVAVSIMTIDAATYHYIYCDTRDRYIRHGMTAAEAAQKAQELMDAAFVNGDAAFQTDASWDRRSPEQNRWHE